jgi:hypothetical protein
MDSRGGRMDAREQRMDARGARGDRGDRGGRGAVEDARSKEERERSRELELLKQQYLGAEKVKKKVVKVTERFKFTFDWDAGEDTSRDLNPLYQNLHGEWLQGGEGKAGMVCGCVRGREPPTPSPHAPPRASALNTHGSAPRTHSPPSMHRPDPLDPETHPTPFPAAPMQRPTSSLAAASEQALTGGSRRSWRRSLTPLC